MTPMVILLSRFRVVFPPVPALYDNNITRAASHEAAGPIGEPDQLTLEVPVAVTVCRSYSLLRGVASEEQGGKDCEDDQGGPFWRCAGCRRWWWGA